MVKKLHKTENTRDTDTPGTDGIPLAGSIKDSAQQIWQAGLGAFAKAQAEGTRAFEALVKEGTAIQRKTQAAAEERISDATNRMTHMASDISSKASGQWDKLENIFEERVAKALNKLGVPSAKDVDALIARIDELNLSVQKLSGASPAVKKKKPAARARPKPAATQAAKAPAKSPTKTARKPAAKRAAASKTTAG